MRLLGNKVRCKWRIEGNGGIKERKEIKGDERILKKERNLEGEREEGRSKSNLDIESEVIINIDIVDEEELVDIRRNLRIIEGIKWGDDIVSNKKKIIMRNWWRGKKGNKLRSWSLNGRKGLRIVMKFMLNIGNKKKLIEF